MTVTDETFQHVIFDYRKLTIVEVHMLLRGHYNHSHVPHVHKANLTKFRLMIQQCN